MPLPKYWVRLAAPLCLSISLLAAPFASGASFQDPPIVDPEEQAGEASGQNCSFRNDPQEYEMREFRTRKEVYERVLRFAKAGRSAARSVSANEVPRRNLIDDQIFGKLAAAGIHRPRYRATRSS